jgi:4-amino-4-deoxy-L-arabinose transferase
MCAAIGWGFEMKATAVLVPVAPMFVYLLLTRQAFSYFATVWSFVCLLIFVAVGLSWYIYTARTLPGAGPYLWDSLVVGRLVTATYNRNPTFVGGLKTYIPALFGGTLPWLPLWVPLAGKLRAAQSGKNAAAELRANPKILLLALWIVLPLAVYFSASSKLGLYVLPIFPSIALLTARALAEFMPGAFGSKYPSRRVWIAMAAWGAVLLGIKLGAAYLPHAKDEGAVWEEIRDKIPPDCSRIVIVNEDLDGLRFYFRKEVVRVTTGLPANDVVDYEPPLALEQGFDAKPPLAVIYLNYHMRPAYRDRLQELFHKHNLEPKEFPLQFDRTLVVCSEATKPSE